ncbi:MAG: NAD-dependent epimerase/dehydratase family protein, partial [Flavobacteriaceae bacterium]|nr:NAD-dependent epimerase/dehydratase family protein [Flavobacteriaceae bacterium]
MHILLTGATGLIGNLLLKRLLVEGHQLSYCTTSKSKLALFPNCKGVYWNPEKLELEYQSLSSVDIIIHLAGATIMQPWTSNNKQQIRNSRVKGLQTLKKYQKYFAPNLSQIVVASAIGAYPDDGKLQFEESFPTYAPNFLGEVTQALEKEAQAFEKLDVLVTTLRFGLVLSKKGGAFVPIEKSVRLGLGASFGSGNQWQSWIHIEDVIGIIHFVLKHRKAGVYNTVAP